MVELASRLRADVLARLRCDKSHLLI